ncbi:MAG: hypothetical protein IJZ86_04570 [Bacteroides sp.]|nr:hypothetical protein [Bacteroides sp.]
MSATTAWKVTCKKRAGKVPIGLSVTIIKESTSAVPSENEIKTKFKNEHGMDVPSGYGNKGYFEMVKL